MDLDVATKSVCVDFFSSHWTGRKRDLKVSAEVAEAHEINVDAGNYNKLLIPKRYVQIFERLISAAYRIHYAYTMPWGEGKLRITTAKTYYDKYAPKMREIIAQFDHEVDEFIRAYPHIVEVEAQDMLKSMFNPFDYPSVDKLKAKFGMRVCLMPVPTVNDFRLEVTEKQITEMKEQWRKESEERAKAALISLWERLVLPLENLARMKDKKRLCNSLIGNVLNVVDVIDDLNVWDDPDLKDMRERLVAGLDGVSMDHLKDNQDEMDRVISFAKSAAKDARVKADNPLSVATVTVATVTTVEDIADIAEKMSFMFNGNLS